MYLYRGTLEFSGLMGGRHDKTVIKRLLHFSALVKRYAYNQEQISGLNSVNSMLIVFCPMSQTSAYSPII